MARGAEANVGAGRCAPCHSEASRRLLVGDHWRAAGIAMLPPQLSLCPFPVAQRSSSLSALHYGARSAYGFRRFFIVTCIRRWPRFLALMDVVCVGLPRHLDSQHCPIMLCQRRVAPFVHRDGVRAAPNCTALTSLRPYAARCTCSGPHAAESKHMTAGRALLLSLIYHPRGPDSEPGNSTCEPCPAATSCSVAPRPRRPSCASAMACRVASKRATQRAGHAERKFAFEDSVRRCHDRGLDFVPLILEAHGGGLCCRLRRLVSDLVSRQGTRARADPAPAPTIIAQRISGLLAESTRGVWRRSGALRALAGRRSCVPFGQGAYVVAWSCAL